MNSFFVSGQPVAQPRHKVGRYGAYIPKDHPIHAWKESIILHYKRTHIIHPVKLRLSFYLKRPKSHYNKSGLKPSAPLYPGKPDLDNLAKAVLDALQTAGAYKDDSEIIELNITKEYAESPGVLILFV